MNAKEKLRKHIWKLLQAEGVAKFPFPIEGRIPNFNGNEKASLLVRTLDIWAHAKVIAVGPDFAQRKLRELALKDGKIVVMATPKLRKGYLLLDPEKVRGKEEIASTIKGAFRYGKLIAIEKMPKPDLIIIGSVGVDLEGNRLGKGGGYGDKEISELKRRFGKIPVLTVVHDLQVVEKVPTEPHDKKVDIIVTPTRVLRVSNRNLT